MAAVTLTKRIGPHELIPVECEVFVLIIIVIQQLPEILLSPQNLCIPHISTLINITLMCATVKRRPIEFQIDHKSREENHGDNSHLHLKPGTELWNCNCQQF